MKLTKGKINSGDAAEDKDVQEIIRLELERAALLVARDLDAVKNLVLDTYTMTHASGVVLSKREVAAALESGELLYEAINRECHSVTLSQNTAAATGVDTIKGIFRGKRVDGKYRFRNTYVQTDGRWILVATVMTRIEK